MAATILAAARIEAGKLREHTQNITAWQDNKLSFEIENKYRTILYQSYHTAIMYLMLRVRTG